MQNARGKDKLAMRIIPPHFLIEFLVKPGMVDPHAWICRVTGSSTAIALENWCIGMVKHKVSR